MDRVNAKRAGCRGLGRVFGGNEQAAHALLHRGQRHGQHARHTAHAAVQRKLADEGVLRAGDGQLPGGSQNGKKNRQVVHRAGLADIAGSEIDGDPADGPDEGQVFQRAAHAVRGLAHSAVRQAHDGELRQSAADIRLHAHTEAIQRIYAQAVDPCKHPSAAFRRFPPHFAPVRPYGCVFSITCASFLYKCELTGPGPWLMIRSIKGGTPRGASAA